MKLNYGMDKKSGNPGSRNSRDGKVKPQHRGQAGISANKGDTQAKGNPGSRNSRNGKVSMPDVFESKSYGKGNAVRGDKAHLMGKEKSGNPGNRNARNGRINKHEMCAD